MRLLIILFGLIAALVAAAGAILPRLVDAEAIRARLLAEVQATIARPIAVRGSAELVLLPRPVLSVGRVTIGSATAEGDAALIEADRLDLDVAPLSLLTGAIEIEGARIVRPRLRLRQQGRDVAGLLAALANDGRWLRALQIVDGQVTVERDNLPTETLEQIELRLSRAADDGLDARGIGRWRQQPWSTNLRMADPMSATGRIPIDLQLSLGSRGRTSLVSLRGQLLPDAGFEGDVRLEAGQLADLLTAGMAAAGQTAAVEHLDLGPMTLGGKLTRAGPVWRFELSAAAVAGGNLTGRIEIDQATPRLDIDIGGTRLSPSDDLLASLAGLATRSRAPAGLTGTVRLHLAGLDWRRAPLRELRLAADLPGNDTLRVERLAARLPDEGEVDIDGSLTGISSDMPTWQGKLSLAVQDARGLLGWLDLPQPAVAPDRLRSLSGTAGLGWSGRQASLRDIDLRLDATRITGSAALALQRRPQLAAALAIDRLPLDGYLPSITPGGLAGALAGVANDIDLALDLDLGVVSWQAIRAERVKLRGTAEGRRVTLRELSVGELAEASGSLVGDGDLATGEMQLALEAQIGRPSRLARLAGFEPPPLLGRLVPVRLSGTARRDATDLQIELDVAAPGLTMDMEGRLPAKLDGPPRLDRLAAEAASFAALVRQMGLPAEAALDRPASLQMTATPRGDGITDLAASAEIAGSHGEARLRHESRGPRPRLAGSLGIDAIDAALARLLWDTGEVTLGFPAGPPSRWPGIWPREPLSWGWLYAADLDIAVSGLANGRVALDSGELQLVVDRAPLAGGTLTGNVTLDGRELVPRLSARLALSGADAGEAMALVGLRDGLRGGLDLSTTLTSSGTNPAALVAALDGEATLRLVDGAFEGVRLEPADIVESGRRELPINALAGQLGIARGLISGDALALTLPEGQAGLSLSLDLPAWILDATIRREGSVPPVRLLGPPGRVRALVPAPAP